MGQECSCCKYDDSELKSQQTADQYIFVEEHQAKKRVSKIEYLQGEEKEVKYEMKFMQMDFQMESSAHQQEELEFSQQSLNKHENIEGNV